MSPNATKATQYITQLDDVRCQGNWDAVPELVRKLRKHAPERSCLAITAEVEHAISTATSKKQPPANRPSTATSISPHAEIANQLPSLIEEVEREATFLQDKFQAQVCVGWLYWLNKEFGPALSRLPGNLDQCLPQVENLDDLFEWTKVCAAKSAYLKANCHCCLGQRDEGLGAFESSLPSLAGLWTSWKAARKQLHYWSELYLTEFCMLSSQIVGEGRKLPNDPHVLAGFRSWARYWGNTKAVSTLPGGSGFRGSVPRRRIWFEYYAVLSKILQDGLTFPADPVPPIRTDLTLQHRLFLELNKVESSCGTLLLGETHFPRANEERPEVEAFTNLLVQNWLILSGKGFREADLGHGGRDSLSRGVLDILYMAAMKSYHSTTILRHLYTIHLAVAEFDLAFKAFDSYHVLITKGKARVEKTGHPEPNLDADSSMLETFSSCIVALCRYGDCAAAEKARDIASELEQWLERLPTAPSISVEKAETTRIGGAVSNGAEEEAATFATSESLGVPPRIIALSWQAVGIAHARWSRMTFDSTARADIQTKAISCLKRSLSSEFGRMSDVRGVFTLSLLLAEQHQLGRAIELVKNTLLAQKVAVDDCELYLGPYWRERSLIPLWHLLALILSARQDFVLAARACEGAFEEFKDPAVLFGSRELNGAFHSDHLNAAEANKDTFGAAQGVVDEMDGFEKASILEVKMTQLALIELLEGPEVAVNASLELLTLYSRLFGGPSTKPSAKLAPDRAPKSSAGTLRSLKGSIFAGRSERGRARHHNATNERMAAALFETSHSAESPAAGGGIMATSTAPGSATTPRIQVTEAGGDGLTTHLSPQSRRAISVHGGNRSMSRKRNSMRKRESSGGSQPPRRLMANVDMAAASAGPAVRNNESPVIAPLDAPPPPPPPLPPSADFFSSAAAKRQVPASTRSRSVSVASGRSLVPTESGLSSKLLRSVDVLGSSVEQVVAPCSATLLPLIQFSHDDERRRAWAMLTQVWLMIAGFYRRADMLEDAQEAIAEAMKLVQNLEAEISRDTTGSLSLRHPGWGGRKSVEELWGDVWAEKGNLSLAKNTPYFARSDFEAALMHFPDHAGAIVGLSNILLDIYAEKLLPIPTLQPLELPDSSMYEPGASRRVEKTRTALPCRPLGLGKQVGIIGFDATTTTATRLDGVIETRPSDQLPAPYQATSHSLVDRIAARDRALALLTGLTKLGSGWNYSPAWFALARAYEESCQVEKAKEILWWCVELEEHMGIREWNCAWVGKYSL